MCFEQYSEGGKLLNLYDWFRSFVVRAETKKQTGKGRKRAAKLDEKSSLSIQARFITALAALHYLGFISSTKRKKDHVAKLCFVSSLKMHP